MNTIYFLVSKTSQKRFLFALMAALIVFNILMNAPGLPTSTPSMQEIYPKFTPFDLQAIDYNVESFSNDLHLLGVEGRNIYKNFMLCDIFFPAIYALTFASLIFLVFRYRNNGLRWLFLIPLLTGLCDYVENVFIFISFWGYPSSNPVMVSIASLATQVKMVFNALLALSLIFTLVMWIGSLVKRK